MHVRRLASITSMAKVLIVDDEPAIVRFLKSFLEKRHYTALTASTGEEALEQFKQERPEIVLLDIRLPDRDGLEVLKEIKRIDPRVSVIVVTAVTDEETGKRALELGAFDYLAKPFELGHLEQVLRWTVKLTS